MSEIVLAASMWTVLLIMSRDPYYGRNRLAIVLYSIMVLLISTYWVFQSEGVEFQPNDVRTYIIAVAGPIYAWAFSTKTQATIIQHGEPSLGRKYGPPKLRLDELEDQSLARRVQISGNLMWGILVLWLLVIAAQTVIKAI